MNPYDQVRYPSNVHAQTHVDRSATVGHLRGMRPASIKAGCRVLELGCGSGANLIAMAAQLPENTFVGVDSAASAISDGIRFAGSLGIANITFECMDLTLLRQQRLQPFDYVIAHGLFSWVPPEVSAVILELCGISLTPHGIAYVSYHTYPGNHLRDLARGVMRYHAGRFMDPTEKIRQARGILHFLPLARKEATPYTRALEAERKRVDDCRDELFYHDDLSTENRSYYFHEFMTEARAFGLKYLGEAGPNELGSKVYTAEALAKFDELQGEDELVQEQYKDFLIGRSFRETLLCRTGVELSTACRPEQVVTLWVGCPARLVPQDEATAFRFEHPEGGELTTNHLLVGSALQKASARWPEFMPFTALVNACCAEIGLGDEASNTRAGHEKQLAEALLIAYRGGLVELRTRPPDVVSSVSARPVTSALARLQVAKGFPAITNQLHQPWRVSDPLVRQLLQGADGSRTQEDLVALTRLGLQNGDLPIAEKREDDREGAGTPLFRRVEAGLAELASAGFFLR